MSDSKRITEMFINLDKMKREVNDLLIEWEQTDFDEENRAVSRQHFDRFEQMEKVEACLTKAFNRMEIAWRQAKEMEQEDKATA